PHGVVAAQAQAEALAGIDAQKLHQPVHGQDSRFYQVGVENGEGGFNAHHPEGALFQTLGFFLGAVGSVVGGDHVDGAIQNALHQSVPIVPTAQGGIHFEPAVLLQHAVIHHQVVGAGFAGDVQSLGLGLADQLHAFLGGDVADVV